MRTGWRWCCGVVVLSVAHAATGVLSAQDQTTVRPSVGLVLSGGGAKGFAHIGVIRMLEESGLPVDLVTGSSMGAILGALYAIGYTADSLEAFVVRQEWDELLIDEAVRRGPRGLRSGGTRFVGTFPIREARPRLPSSLVEGQRFAQLLARLVWPAHSVHDFRALPLPFAAVATDLETGAGVMLDSGFLPQALHASAAVPSVFAPVLVGGRLLADGGLARNLPAQEARTLGAEVVICSDVSDPLAPADSLRTFLDVLDQSIAFRMNESNEAQRRLCDVLIRPPLEGLSASDFDRAGEWIARGASAALRALPELMRLVGAAPPGVVRRTPLRLDSVFVEAIVLDGLDPERHAFARKLLGVAVGDWVSPDRIEDAIDRLYSTGLFTSVRYRHEVRGANEPLRVTLTIMFDERSRDGLGFGYRYESRYKGSVVFGATVHNTVVYGSRLQVEARLGEQGRLTTEYVQRIGPGDRLAVGLSGAFTRAPFDVFRDVRRIGSALVNVFEAAVGASFRVGRDALAGFELRGEHARGDPRQVAESGDDLYRTFYTLGAELQADTYDDDFFPVQGYSIHAKTAWADGSLRSGAAFVQTVLRASAHVPVRPRLALFGSLTVGTTSGSDLPPHHRFYLGGTSDYYLFPDRQFAFVGWEPQARSGRHVQILHIGAQYGLTRDVFALARWNAGMTSEEWAFEPGNYINGWGLTLGARSVFGQVRLTAATRDVGRRPDVEVDLGFQF